MSRRIVSARDQVEMLSPWRTAGPRRRFTQDWQHIGFDLMPVDAVSHYMQRKETGFGDEKHELYQLNKQPPLSQQIRDNGYEKAVHLVTDGRSGSIYDGHHRIDIARQLGHTHIPVEVSWRTPDPGYPQGSYGNRIEPWLKSWLTDMRGGRETVGRRTAALHPLPQHGVNINDTKQDFTGQILRGEKLIETRNTNSLRPIIGHHVAIIRNHMRQPSGLLVGYATIGEPKIYTNADDFDADYHLHQVAPGSDFHIDHPNCKYGIKYGYPLHDVQAEPDPYRIVGPGQPYRYWMQPRMAGVDKSYEQHLRDTYEPYPPDSPGLPEDLKPHLMLPTEVVHHYREYDRPTDGENTRMLTRVLGDQGIRQPLKISTDGSHAVLIEGNHRIQAARQLGMSHVPVQVYLEKPGEVMTNSETSRPVPLEPVLGNWIKQNSHQLRSFWS